MEDCVYGVKINKSFFDYGYKLVKDGVEKKWKNKLEPTEDMSRPRTYTGGGHYESNPYIINFDIMIEALEKTLEGKPTSIESEYVHDLIGEKYFEPVYFVYFKNNDITYTYRIKKKEIHDWDRGVTRRIGDFLYNKLLEYYELVTDKELYTFEIRETKSHKYFVCAKNEEEAQKQGTMILDNQEEYQSTDLIKRKEYVYREVVANK